jgi:RimJ/RimL family protein N-acetyltransferase
MSWCLQDAPDRGTVQEAVPGLRSRYRVSVVAGAQVLLETARLVLRRFEAGDADALVELDGDPEVMRFITGGVPTSREQIEREVLPAFLGDTREDGYGFWAAVDKQSQEFVGWFHLRPGSGSPPDVPELGYRLRRTAWGRGLATEGSTALVDHAFSALGAARVVAETMAMNLASRRVMEHVGMSLVREFHADWPYRIEGEEHGDVEYAVTREQWEGQRGRSIRGRARSQELR